MRKIILAVSALMGTIIGAGIYGIPFVVNKSGIVIGAVHLIVIALLTMITMLYLGEVSLRTKGDFHMTEYAGKYLGNKGRMIMLFAIVFGVCSAIIAYLIGAGESLSFLLSGTGNYAFLLGLVFWAVVCALSFYGVKALERGEFMGIIFVGILMISLVAFFSNKIELSNFNNETGGLLNSLAPFGVIMFAFLGYNVIPEVKKILKNNKRRMKKSIIIAVLICTVIYALFSFIVIGFKGIETPEIATIALGGPFMLLGVLTMFMAYLSVFVSFTGLLQTDFGQTKTKAWLWVSLFPLFIFCLLKLGNFTDFTKIIGIGGVISGGMTAILILLMNYNAKYLGEVKPEYSIPISKLFIVVLAIIYILGIAVELIFI